jgi:hypothetical protein
MNKKQVEAIEIQRKIIIEILNLDFYHYDHISKIERIYELWREVKRK